MSFKLTEFIIESVIRDGFKIIRNSLGTDLDIVDDIFGEMLQPHLAAYYGQKEINKIKELVKDEVINISQGYNLQDVKTPVISINLANNIESENYAAFEDFLDEVDTPITPTLMAGPFNATSYNSVTGFIDVDIANPDLSIVHTGHIFVDGDNNKYPIVGGIDNDVGQKHFMLDRDLVIDNLDGCIIQANTEISRRVRRATREQEMITITIMSQNQLITKYLYILVKYLLLSNKKTLIERGLELTSYDGTDFMRSEHLPSNVFTRFLTVRSGFIEHSWTAETHVPFGYADPAIKVKRDVLLREDESDLTVKTVVDNA